MNDFFPEIYGNLALKEHIGQSIRDGRILHSYLIEGGNGSGKMMLAKQFAAALSCTSTRSGDVAIPCGKCNMCRKILSGECTDVTVIDRGTKATISVDAIREMKRDVYLAPNEADWKIYIIDGAEFMTAGAQNALLKILEEPPRNVVIFLLCERADSLLITVRSRAQILKTERFSQEDLTKFLCEKDNRARTMSVTAPDRFSALLVSANGCIGRALELLESKTLDSLIQMHAVIVEVLRAASPKEQYTRMYSAIAAFPTTRQELADTLSLFMLAIRDLVVVRRTDNAPLCFFENRGTAMVISESMNLKTIINMGDIASRACTSVLSNANIALVLSDLGVELREAMNH